ncbi:LysR family transcriptional regulator [Acinetobacter baumannii]|uniref:LysR family transcriptional regulator n=1 Tax=Acinetobacter baumannii TaxID=470 RepID=UPI0007111A9E|nr:LysR family transcriptional regulator [Acinetobacter baumannii]EHU3230143.1 LysR family transcriptional regulator [Acinetobacter baumannii]KRI84470.1 LysR family transcriptional regulator [Acinetobacter baumannii]TPR58257.1 LysR family transcriptional regulator [Acinetobacter baumannii]
MDLTNSIDIRTLRFFISVYNAQNFSNVARKEDVSASMISRTIQQLEDALGQQLFYRNTRAITPTESGKLFFEYAKRITEQVDEAQKALQDKTIEPSGLVRINAPVFFGQRHIAPWLAGLSERYPRLLIELIQTDEFIDPLRESTDLIFRIGALTDSSFHARIFGTQKYHLAASPQYVAKYGTLDHPTELNQHKCLVYKGFEGPNRWLVRKPNEEWVHYPITPLLSSNNAESLMTAALHGMGIVLFPDWLIGEALKKGDLIKLLPEYEVAIKSQPQHIAAIYPNVRHPPLNIRAVIDYFAEIYGDTPYWQN